MRILLLLLGIFLATQASAASKIGGPLGVAEYRVIDGDTLDVTVEPWPEWRHRERRLRIRGIDAPEIFRPKCPSERVRGAAATEFLRALLQGKVIILSQIEVGADLYGGVVADVYANGVAVADEMIKAGHARVFVDKRQPWCP